MFITEDRASFIVWALERHRVGSGRPWLTRIFCSLQYRPVVKAMFITEDRASFIVWALERHSQLTFDWVSSQQTKDTKKWVFTAFPD